MFYFHSVYGYKKTAFFKAVFPVENNLNKTYFWNCKIGTPSGKMVRINGLSEEPRRLLLFYANCS
jgi:hypothetical protein